MNTESKIDAWDVKLPNGKVDRWVVSDFHVDRQGKLALTLHEGVTLSTN